MVSKDNTRPSVTNVQAHGHNIANGDTTTAESLSIEGRVMPGREV